VSGINHGAPAFTPESSWATLRQVCRTIGTECGDARLLRLGENAIYHVPAIDLVIRIARGVDVLEDASKEVRVSRWLRRAGLLAAELATVLRQLHALVPPLEVELPSLDMFDRVDIRIDRAADIPERDRSFLRERVAELRGAYAGLNFPLNPCAVHGDAHTANLIQEPNGTTRLIDFERFAFGQPEIDLAVTAVEHQIGWHTDSEYGRFVKSYGFDVTDWSGFSVIREISELKMTTWIMQNSSHSPDIASETRNRLDALRDSNAPRHWKPF
jgi:thiamine kinase-like enzyme